MGNFRGFGGVLGGSGGAAGSKRRTRLFYSVHGLYRSKDKTNHGVKKYTKGEKLRGYKIRLFSSVLYYGGFAEPNPLGYRKSPKKYGEGPIFAIFINFFRKNPISEAPPRPPLYPPQNPMSRGGKKGAKIGHFLGGQKGVFLGV